METPKNLIIDKTIFQILRKDLNLLSCERQKQIVSERKNFLTSFTVFGFVARAATRVGLVSKCSALFAKRFRAFEAVVPQFATCGTGTSSALMFF